MNGRKRAMQHQPQPYSLTRHRDTTALARLKRSVVGLRANAKRFFCRLDVLWPLLYFFFLIAVGSATTSVTQGLIKPYLMRNWHTAHQLRVTSIHKQVDQVAARTDEMAAVFLAMHLQSELVMESQETLAMACSILAAFDTRFFFRAIRVASFVKGEMVECMHGMESLGSVTTMAGIVSHNSTIDGAYLVDSTSYRYAVPVQQLTEVPADRHNVTEMMVLTAQYSPIFDIGRAYYDGAITRYDRRVNWLVLSEAPHLMVYNLPVSMLAGTVRLSANRSIDDFVQVRVDGSRMLTGQSKAKLAGMSVAAFIFQSLNSSDPQVLSNTWGQPSVSNNSIYIASTLIDTTYLTVSNISDPLMRAALKHVSLSSLQREGYNVTVDFYYRGALASVTAIAHVTNNGCPLYLVYVSSQAAVSGPHIRVMRICSAALLLATVLFSVGFGWFIHSQFSAPLLRLGAIMQRNVETGSQDLYTSEPSTCMRLKEVRRLTRTYNRAMQRLQQIEAFIPISVRECLDWCRYRVRPSSASVTNAQELGRVTWPRRRSHDLCTETRTAVYLSLTKIVEYEMPCLRMAQLLQRLTQPQPQPQVVLSASEEVAPKSVRRVTSGPFNCAEALEAFVEALHSIAATHNGMVHYVSPDKCVVHFGAAAAAAESAAPGDGSNVESGIRADARDALGFVWEIQNFVCDPYNDAGVQPHILVDTTTFVCGQYRAACSEHVLSVALGRDVQRDLGYLLPQRRVDVAMTEETARRVRAEWNGQLEPGVRQIPFEAVSTERAGGRGGGDGDGAECVVLLFEALQGPVAGDHAWQRYAQRCFEGFSYMLKGNYAAALEAFTRIREIADLEPGLLPMSLEREAAVSFRAGGARSVQVERMMRECRRRVRLLITQSLCRRRCWPAGMVGGTRLDAKIATATPHHPHSRSGQSSAPLSTLATHPPAAQSMRSVSHTNCLLEGSRSDRQRYLVTVHDGFDAEGGQRQRRHVLGDPPERVRDNRGRRWHLSTPLLSSLAFSTHYEHAPDTFVSGFSTRGALCLASQRLLRDVHPIVAKVAASAPDGPMSDALRSAVPVCSMTEEQCTMLAAVAHSLGAFAHPNLILPTSYTTSVEGVVVVLWPYSPCPTLRRVLQQYPHLSNQARARLMLPALTALSYLHAHGAVHGEVTLDTIRVGADNGSRLVMQGCGNPTARRLFAARATCYVSPLMAAGGDPTRACDVFCYGLLCLDVLSGGKPWKWAAAATHQHNNNNQEKVDDDGSAKDGEEDGLTMLMRRPGPAFYRAVVNGVIVPNTDVLAQVGAMGVSGNIVRVAVRDCLSPDPSKRPTAEKLCAVTQLFISTSSSTDA